MNVQKLKSMDDSCRIYSVDDLVYKKMAALSGRSRRSHVVRRLPNGTNTSRLLLLSSCVHCTLGYGDKKKSEKVSGGVYSYVKYNFKASLL